MKRIFILIIAVVIALAGCSTAPSQSEPSYDEADVAAYINDHAVSATEMQHFIDMSKLYWQAIYDLGPAPSGSGRSDGEQRSLEWVFNENYLKAGQYVALDDKGWKNEYYSVLLKSADLNKRDASLSGKIQSMLDAYIQQITDTGVMDYVDGSKLDLKSMLQTLADKYNASCDNITDVVLRPFLQALAEDEALLAYFAKDGYQGTVVELGDNNIDEYIAFLDDVYAQYADYTAGLLKQADIAEK